MSTIAACLNLSVRLAILLVIRDVEHRLCRIVGTDYPFQYIGIGLAQVNHRFGIELVLALRSEKVNQLKENLSTLYPADDENGWRKLTSTQLQEIRNLAPHGTVHKSTYVTPKTHWGLKYLPAERYKSLPKLKEPAGYVCVVQGVKPGQYYQIWRTTNLSNEGGLLGIAGRLNNPHDALHARESVKFRCIVRSDRAKAFESFLKERYKQFKCKRGLIIQDNWYKLAKPQLQEIVSLGE